MQFEVCHFCFREPLFGDPGAEFEELWVADLRVVASLIRVLLVDDH